MTVTVPHRPVWDTIRRLILYSFVALVFVFLVFPTLIIAPLSVTDSIYLQFPPKGFTLRWYQDYFGVRGASHFGSTGRWVPATIISLQLGLSVVAISVPIGCLAAYGLTRGNYRGKALFSAIIVSPLIMPVLVTAIAMFFFLSKNLRGFFQPFPLPSLSPAGEWAVISFALAIGAASLLFLLAAKGRKGSGPADAPRAWHALRPWAVAALVISVSFIFMLWVVGVTDGREGGLFSKADPIPSMPLVSPGLVVAHVVLTLPYVVVILGATLRGMDETLEHAAATLGAPPATVLLRVVLPAIKTGLATSAFFCFIVSWDEPVVALFLSTAEVTTLPKEIWDGIRTEISPTIAAIATLLVVLTIILMGAVHYMQKESKH